VSQSHSLDLNNQNNYNTNNSQQTDGSRTGKMIRSAQRSSAGGGGGGSSIVVKTGTQSIVTLAEKEQQML